MAGLARAFGAEEAAPAPGRSMSARELLMGTSFRAVLGQGAGAQLTSWGQGASVSRFSSAVPGLALSGETATGALGMDYEHGRLLAGFAMTHSLGEGRDLEQANRWRSTATAGPSRASARGPAIRSMSHSPASSTRAPAPGSRTWSGAARRFAAGRSGPMTRCSTTGYFRDASFGAAAERSHHGRLQGPGHEDAAGLFRRGGLAGAFTSGRGRPQSRTNALKLRARKARLCTRSP